MYNLAENLRLIRLIRGMSIRQVAQKVDRTPGTISNWETGKISPDVDTIEKLCALYDISPNELLGWSKCKLIDDFKLERAKDLLELETLNLQRAAIEAKIKEKKDKLAKSIISEEIN